MKLRPGHLIAFIALAVALAAFFIAMGFWQIRRLGARRALNDTIRAQLAMPSVPYVSLGHDSASANRQAVVAGTPDYDNEFVYAGRSRAGSPGVHIFTPVRLGESTAVLVNRGWVYSADAATVDLARWKEQRRVFRGYTRELPLGKPMTTAASARRIRTLSYNAIRPLVPYAVSRLYVVSQDSASAVTPARLPQPDLSDGPHLGYAIQWFSFAAIALVGAGIILRLSLARRVHRLDPQ